MSDNEHKAGRPKGRRAKPFSTSLSAFISAVPASFIRRSSSSRVMASSRVASSVSVYAKTPEGVSAS